MSAAAGYAKSASTRTGRLPTVAAALPFSYYIAHVFRASVTYPSHQFTVKLEIRSALAREETTNILSTFVLGIDFSSERYRPAVPIKLHLRTS